MPSPRVTIADVARRAGVSPTAVSFAFHKPAQLSPETVERIMAAVSELGYAPSPFARALVSRQVGTVGVLLPQDVGQVFENPFFASFLQGVGSACAEHERSLLVVGTSASLSLEQVIARAPVDGFIIVGIDERHAEVAPLRRRGTPFVIVDGDAETVASVNVDDEGGAYAAAAELLGRGHRDVLVLTFETPYGHLEDPYHGVGGRRLHGYQRAFRQLDVPWRDPWLVPTLSSFNGGAAAFSDSWQAGMRPTAVIAVSDMAAIGAVSAARSIGIRIPDDIEVIGFDDLPISALAHPALSTVRQPIVEKGRLAAELLLDAIADRRAPEQVVLPTELVLRGTTRPVGRTDEGRE